MRAAPPAADIEIIVAQFEAAAGLDRLRALNAAFGQATAETVEAILREASRLAEAYLEPLNEKADSEGCRLSQGRVQTVAGHKEAWAAYVEGGWSTLDQPEAEGGQGLPRAVSLAVQALLDRACPAFGMLCVAQRSAARLIGAYGDEATRTEWLGKLISGEWGATICISESDAGSDVGRIRTRAEPLSNGEWEITGEKCWISYGDHDLTSRIGHCLLARTPGSPPGVRGLSLFLVADRPETTGTDVTGVKVSRLEHKMGLHGSPTCVLQFDRAVGRMLGQEGRGLAQMFVMITNMRLSVATQGVGIASAANDVAIAYAKERRQGGSGPVAKRIVEHPDIQRQLLESIARVETLRGLVMTAAVQADLADHETDPDARTEALALMQWLLPIVKTVGGEAACETADIAIQVLGGAGYTGEWPVEQYFRDARVLTIFEGTTGIQALDLVERRLRRDGGPGLAIFLTQARKAAALCPEPQRRSLESCLDSLQRAAGYLSPDDRQADAEAGATAFLHLAALAALGWIAARLTVLEPINEAQRTLSAAGRYWLQGLDHRAASLFEAATAGVSSLAAAAEISVLECCA